MKKFLFALPVLVAIAAAAILGAIPATVLTGGRGLDQTALVVGGLAAGFAVLCLVCGFVAMRQEQRIDQMRGELADYEHAVSLRLAKLEASRHDDGAAGANHRQGTREVALVPASDPDIPVTAARLLPLQENPTNDGNVVSLQSAQRERAGNDRRHKARNQEIEAAIRESRFEAWFQPVVSLPQRKSRYLHAVPYLAQQRGPALPPSEWMRTAQKLGNAAAVDHFMLLQGLKLVRDLKRNGKPCGVIWRIGRASFQDAERFEAIADILKANVAVSSLFVCELTLPDYKNLTNPELDRLFVLREAGYRICLGDCSDLVALSRTLKTRIFGLAAVDAAVLIQGSGFGASTVGDLSTTMEMIATGVASEADAIALLDVDVSLAQGPLFSPPRPLRRDMGAPGAPEGVA